MVESLDHSRPAVEPLAPGQDRKEAAALLLEIGVIKQIPDLSKLADTQFIQ